MSFNACNIHLLRKIVWSDWIEVLQIIAWLTFQKGSCTSTRSRKKYQRCAHLDIFLQLCSYFFKQHFLSFQTPWSPKVILTKWYLSWMIFINVCCINRGKGGNSVPTTLQLTPFMPNVNSNGLSSAEPPLPEGAPPSKWRFSVSPLPHLPPSKQVKAAHFYSH